MILVIGRVRCEEPNRDALVEALKRMQDESRKEDGCILYAFAEDVLDPGLVRIVERWRDWPSLEAHGKAPHLDAWRKKVAEAGVLDREVIAHSTSESRTL